MMDGMPMCIRDRNHLLVLGVLRQVDGCAHTQRHHDDHGYDDNIERIQDVWQNADGVRPVTGLGADELPAQVRNTPEEDVTDQENQQGTGDAGAEVHKPPQQRILRLAAKGTTLCFHIKHAPF